MEIKCDQKPRKKRHWPLYYLNSDEQQAKSNRYFSQEIISASRTYFLENTHSLSTITLKNHTDGYLYIWSILGFAIYYSLTLCLLQTAGLKTLKVRYNLLSVCWNFKLTKLEFTAESHSLYTRSPMWCAIHPISLCSALIIFIYA